MAAATPLKRPIKVSQLMRKRLKELQRTPRELAEAVQVPETYIADLLAGRRRPPAPGRTDVYDRMTKFLRLHRNDLPTCARAEREGDMGGHRRPDVKVRDLLLQLCDPAKARVVNRRLASKKDSVAFEILIAQRLLEVAQGFVRRQLDDEVGIRVAANREGCSYLEMRMRLIDFLDVTPESLTVTDHEVFVRPRIATWDIDFETHAMRIVLRSHEPEPRQQRALRL
ncbi:MAG: helix-turn-helix transcriptional regulator [Gemmatimonadetes bacterium]|nr:helix-turn-helix transcriptional regulator [Gemmatimonadota bacterium]